MWGKAKGSKKRALRIYFATDLQRDSLDLSMAMHELPPE